MAATSDVIYVTMVVMETIYKHVAQSTKEAHFFHLLCNFVFLQYKPHSSLYVTKYHVNRMNCVESRPGRWGD